MPEALLTTLAQVGLGITGFAGIAIVLIANEHPEWAIKQYTSIKSMLETSLSVMMFSLFPLTLDLIVSDSSTGLAYLSVVFALWHLLIFSFGVSRRERFWVGIKINVVIVLSILVILTQLIVGLLGSSEYLIDAYLLGLFWILLISVLQFCTLIYSSFKIAD